MRRALVLTNEAARHPFRASLPPCVFARAGSVEQSVPWRQRLGLSRRDLETVAVTYSAAFVATITFIA